MPRRATHVEKAQELAMAVQVRVPSGQQATKLFTHLFDHRCSLRHAGMTTLTQMVDGERGGVVITVGILGNKGQRPTMQTFMDGMAQVIRQGGYTPQTINPRNALQLMKSQATQAQR